MNKMTEIGLAGLGSASQPSGGRRAARRRARARRAILIAALVLLACAYAIAACLLFQSIFYRGLIQSLGEWQFAHVGGFFPAITFAVLYLLFSLPLLGLFLLLGRQRKRMERERPPLARLMEGAARLRRFLSVASVTMVLASMVSLGLTPFLPDDSGPRRTVVVGDATPAEGHVRLLGSVDLDHVARFSRRALFLRREILVTPVRAPGEAQGAARFFVEILPEADAGRAAHMPVDGVLRRNGLPGEVVALYRAAGVPVAGEPYLLYRSGAGIRWPYYQLALQFGLAALLLGGASWLEDRRYRRLLGMLNAAGEAPIKV